MLYLPARSFFLAAVLVSGAVRSTAGQPSPTAATPLPGYRLFLTDGTAVPILGEWAVVGDLAVSTVVTGTISAGSPRLQLVSLPRTGIDWPRTERDASRVRREMYLATRAADDYALLTAEVADALNQSAQAPDDATKLKIVQQARQRAAAWPAEHYGYRSEDVRELIGLLDGAINAAQAPAGNGRFDLTFVASVDPVPAASGAVPAPEPEAPATPQQQIAMVWSVAQQAAVPAERVSLAQLALSDLRSRASDLPREWSRQTRTAIEHYVAAEMRIDRKYAELGRDAAVGVAQASQDADVRRLLALDQEVRRRDRALGVRRPELVSGVLASIATHLATARQVRLARDHYLTREPLLRRYRAAVSPVIRVLTRGRDALEDIRMLAGPDRRMLERVADRFARARARLLNATPPDELRSVHDLFTAAVTMAATAVENRKSAVMLGSGTLAWNASAAAAGAQLLLSRAVTELNQALRQPGP